MYIEQEEDRTYQPALDTHKMTVGMVIDRIDRQGSEEFLRGATPEMKAFWQRYQQITDEHNTLKEIRIDEIAL